MCAAHCAGVVVMDARAAFETSVSNGAIPSTPPFTLTVSGSCSQRGEGAGMLGPAGTQSGPTSWCKGWCNSVSRAITVPGTCPLKTLIL